MEVNDIKFRCSSLGYIMTEGRKGSSGLSETAKTHCIDVLVSAKYNRFTEIHSKYLDKGNDVEEDSITTISRITKQFFKKNTDSLSNEFIKGTPDIFQGENIMLAEVIRDAKSSWDVYTFQRSKYKELDSKYFWQGQGYCWLTGAKKFFIDYCLNNTPYHIVEGELRKESYRHPEGATPAWVEIQIIANHVYDKKTFEDYIQFRGCHPIDDNSRAVKAGFVEIPLHERHFCFEVQADTELQERIKTRVIECREFIKTLL